MSPQPKAEPLDGAWRVVFDEAWASFQADNFGIGAALVDPATGEVVATGRNRVAQTEPQERTLSGNMTAHAEMNAFAALDRFNADGLHLYTTLEPCLMCAASAMLLRVGHVHYAAIDEFFVGMDELWPHFVLTAERQPESTGPLATPLRQFARLLPMIFTLRNLPERTAAALAREAHPELARLIDDLPDDGAFADIVADGSVDDALGHLWDRLGGIS